MSEPVWAPLVEIEVDAAERLYMAFWPEDIPFTPPGDTVERTYQRGAGSFSAVEIGTALAIPTVQLVVDTLHGVLDARMRTKEMRGNEVALRIARGPAPWTHVRSFFFRIGMPKRERDRAVLTLSSPFDALAYRGMTMTLGSRFPFMGRDARVA